MSGQTILYLIYMLVAASAILVIEAVYLNVSRGRAKAGAINRRLKRLGENAGAETALQSLLVERGLDTSGNFAFRVLWLNRLFTQSGVTGSPVAFAAMFVMAGVAVGMVLRLLVGAPLLVSFIALLVVGIALPLLVLRRARNRRIARFAAQLPDALDMIVRSLRAGHPTSVAIALVAREMSDPLGTEFGIVSDEITFGLSLEQAVLKLVDRVGFEGVSLLSVSLSIQAKTGGNLTEILSKLAGTLRERQRLKMKVRALSAEGRWSAIIISMFPVVMFGVLMLISPTYYGKVWGDPLITPAFVIFGCWALLGDFIMYRMVNFDF